MWSTVYGKNLRGKLLRLGCTNNIIRKKALQWDYVAHQQGTFIGKRFLIELKIVETVKALPYTVCKLNGNIKPEKCYYLYSNGKPYKGKY